MSAARFRSATPPRTRSWSSCPRRLRHAARATTSRKGQHPLLDFFRLQVDDDSCERERAQIESYWWPPSRLSDRVIEGIVIEWPARMFRVLRGNQPGSVKSGRRLTRPRDRARPHVAAFRRIISPYSCRHVLPSQELPAREITRRDDDQRRHRIPSHHEERAVIGAVRRIEGRGDAVCR
jgi:hypothetical protein